MNEISDASLLAALQKTLAGAVAKQNVRAGNLANLNTPGYKTREARFDDALQEQLAAATMKGTDRQHLQGADLGIATEEVRDLPTRRDGNNVQLDRELFAMTRASGEFQRAQTALAAKFRLVRYAISEGK